MSRRLDPRIRRADSGEKITAAAILVDHSRPAGDLAGPSAEDRIQAARRAGYDEGYRAATEEMLAAEVASRSAQLRRVADAVVSAADQVARTRSEVVTMGAGEAVELAYQLAEAFLQHEMSAGRTVVDAVTRALQIAPEGHDLVVRLHPGDSVEPEELAALVPDVDVKIVADPKIEEGGCVVSAGSCRIDTQLHPALSRARQVLAEFYPTPSEVQA